MLRSVLVPLDGSTLSEGSLALAGRIARGAGASVHLAHVHEPYEPDHLLFRQEWLRRAREFFEAARRSGGSDAR